MLSLKKRKSEKGAVPLVPPWHPNFRNFDRLPDTKAVRTSFFVNGVAVFIAVSLLLVLAYQEYQLAMLRRQIGEWQVQIDRTTKSSQTAVSQFKKFQEEEKRITEIDGFLKSKIVLSDLMLNLGRTLPQRIALQSVSYKDTGVSLKGVVRGAGDRASGEVGGYVERLKKEKVFSDIFEAPLQSNILRDPATGRMTFELLLKFKGAPATPAKK